VVGLRALPFWDLQDFPKRYQNALNLLENSYKIIRNEFGELDDSFISKDGQNLSEYNDWKMFHFQFNGIV